MHQRKAVAVAMDVGVEQDKTVVLRGRRRLGVVADVESFFSPTEQDAVRIETHQHDFGSCGECICGIHRDPPRVS